MTAWRSFEVKILAAFMAAALVVAALTGLTWKLDSDATDAVRWVGHTHEVMRNLAYIRANTLQIELNGHNYRSTGDPAYLKDRDVTVEARETVLTQLQHLTADNVGQQDRWKLLREVVDQRLAIAREVEALRKTEGAEAANRYVTTATVLEVRRRTAELLQAMETEEAQLLQRRTEDQQNAHHAMVAAAIILALTLTLLLVGTYVLIRRQLREKQISDQALADNEESLSTTLHSIGDGVLATDTEGRITRMNPVAERLTGWPQELARGLPIEVVFKIIHEYTRAPAEVPIAQVLATGQVQELANHTALIARDGTECPIADSAAPIRDAAGVVRGVVLVFRDETRVRLAERLIEEQNELLERRVEERTTQLRDSEDHLRSVISHVPALIAYVDTEQRYVHVNDQYRHQFAPDADSINGLTVHEVLGNERYAVAAPMIERTLRGHLQAYDWQPFDGVWHFINYIPRFNDNGDVLGYYVLGTDITERKKNEEQIRSLNTELAQRVMDLERVTRALHTLSAGNRLMLRATDEQQLLEDMCKIIVHTGGYETATAWFVDESDAGLLHARAQAGHADGLLALADSRLRALDRSDALRHAIQHGETSTRTSSRPAAGHDVEAHSPSFAVSEVVCPLRVHGKIVGALEIHAPRNAPFDPEETALLSESADDLAFGIATLRSQAEHRRTQENMQRMSRYDGLTNLSNEARFTELLAGAIENGTRHQRPFAVLQINLERLREINDALGFNHGDQLLREFGIRLQSAVPDSAHVARLRGDEFAILLEDTGRQTALAMVQTIKSILRPAFLVADIPLDVSVHTGITFFPEHGETPHELYRHMDIAVNQAKKATADHAIFDPIGSSEQKHRLSMAGELRRAIENGDLELHVQPKVEMVSGNICGAEGLVRWRHKTRGMILPMEFVGLAEHTGLIKPLTEWVLQAGLDLMAGWSRNHCHQPIAVNISARNFRDEGFLKKVQDLLATQLLPSPASRLEMEITETTVMEDAEFALKVLHGLREQGISLYIDDFGTGYSSLTYLQQLPVEYIKIDKSFVLDMCKRNDSAVIVRSTIDLVHDLERKVVAEGVETLEQWRQLQALGCDMGQGYLMAKPMPGHEFPMWVRGFMPPDVALLAHHTATVEE